MKLEASRVVANFEHEQEKRLHIKSFTRDSDVVTGLAAVDQIVETNDPYGGRKMTHGKAVNLFLNLQFLIVFAEFRPHDVVETFLDRPTDRHELIAVTSWVAEESVPVVRRWVKDNDRRDFLSL